jgi:hypothetical protein
VSITILFTTTRKTHTAIFSWCPQYPHVFDKQIFIAKYYIVLQMHKLGDEKAHA